MYVLSFFLSVFRMPHASTSFFLNSTMQVLFCLKKTPTETHREEKKKKKNRTIKEQEKVMSVERGDDFFSLFV
jgi:hypothetical protein